jgi:protein arginine N-methyltransferase 3
MSQALGVTPPDEDAIDDDAPANVGAGLLSGGGGGGGGGGGKMNATAPAFTPTKKPSAGPVMAGAAADQPGPRTTEQAVDDDYFGSYSYFDIHRTMLDDVARTATYRTSLEKNPSLIAGKKVVDIGCGTGILSMFAARGGAEVVVGVDGAAQIAAVARANIAHAGLGGKVSVVQGKVEELLAAGSIPGAGTFDVLVSEWMGYALLYESMLDTVLAARDTLLKPGGAVLPDIATIHVAGFSRNATSLPFWDDVYGFEMPVVQSTLLKDALKSAVVCPVKGDHVVTSSAEVRSLDMATMTVADTEFSSGEYVLTARADGTRGDELDAEVQAGKGEGATGLTQQGALLTEGGDGSGPVMCYGVVLWFDTAFSARFCKEEAVILSTSPYAKQTHWAQTMLHFPEPIALAPARGGGGGSAGGAVGSKENPAAGIKVRVGMAKCTEEERLRALDISLEYTAVASDGKEGSHHAKIFRM